MRIGIYGGTFNPPHKGHIKAANTAVKKLGLEKLFVIPANIPPHKELPKDDPGGEMRLNMTRMAFSEVANSEVLDIELLREGPSYTIETIKQLKNENPSDEFVLLMGTDMLLYIEHWKNFKEIFSEVKVCAFARAGGEMEKLKSFSEYLKKEYDLTVEIIENDAFEISSSEIRECLSERKGNEYLTDGVYSLIIKERIYGAKPNYEWLREKAYGMMLPKRIPHVQGCEITAVELAKIWGADVEEAREAAILHDITKHKDLTSQLILCDKYGIILDTLEKDEVKLLHSKTGAGIAKYEFGCSDAVYDAIFWHTTGREDMALLEKIIYMADYIEPNRDFDGLTELRALAKTDIDEAMYVGIGMSLDDMYARGIEPHTRSKSAMDWFRDRKIQGEGTNK